MIPAFNGGTLLAETLRSCLVAGFDSAHVAVIVCDNGSGDGSFEAAEALARESHGLLHVSRNESNLGRVGNWNRCLERAEALGAAYGTFLMVGDEWLRGADAIALVAAMREANASLALTRYHIVNASGRLLREARTFIREPRRVESAQPFVARALAGAALCFGPLQANVYRLDGSRRLRFDADDPTHTDQRATFDFLGNEAGTLLLWGTPCIGWKVHPGRFHMAMDVGKRLLADRELVRSQAAARGVVLDERRVRTSLFLLAAREWAGRPGGWQKIREAARALELSAADWPLAALHAFRRVALGHHFT
jgi:glycosyltransferase involved in cell wall biosynthesis